MNNNSFFSLSHFGGGGEKGGRWGSPLIQLGKWVCGTEPSRDWLSRQGGAGSSPHSKDLHGSWRGHAHLLFLCAPGCAPGLCPRWALLLLCLPPLSKLHLSLRAACRKASTKVPMGPPQHSLSPVWEATSFSTVHKAVWGAWLPDSSLWLPPLASAQSSSLKMFAE